MSGQAAVAFTGSESWRPFAGEGLIAGAFIGCIGAALLFGIYGALIGAAASYWILYGLTGLAFLGWLLLVQRHHRLLPPWAMYLIPGGGALVLTGFVLASGLDPHRFLLLYALVAILVGAGFPRPGQVTLHVVAVLGLAVVLSHRGYEPPELLVPLGLYVVVAYVAATFARDLQEAIAREATAAADASRRAELLRAAVAVHDLDVEQAAETAVVALADLGFEIAILAIVDEAREAMVPIASRGMADEIRVEPIPVGRGLAGQAVVRGEPVEAEDYHRFEARLPGREAVRSGIAVPVEVAGRVGAVLQGGRWTPGRCTPAEREVIEVLADQVGRAIENAQAFEVERQVVARLRQLDELKGEFVSNVSHELRTPLTVIQGLGQTLAARQDDLDADRRRDFLRRIAANAERLGTMIDAMLDFSRFEGDGVRPELQVVDVGRLALLAAERLEPLLADRPLEVLIESAAVECDPNLIEHVIENLIANAAKHTPPATRVRIVVASADGAVQVAVEDRGEGIPDDELPYLTERFFRGAVQTRHPSPGLGLGLALVRQILEGHGTELEVENLDGGGARFGFRLPVARGVTASLN